MAGHEDTQRHGSGVQRELHTRNDGAHASDVGLGVGGLGLRALGLGFRI